MSMYPVLPEAPVAGVTTGKISHQIAKNKRYNNPTRYNVKEKGAAGNGVDNDSPAINAAYANAPAGAIVQWPPGLYPIDPDTLNMLATRRLEGDGQYASVIKLRSDTPGAAINIDIAASGGIRGVYGPMVKGLGIDLSAAPSATGIRAEGVTGWAWVDDVRVEGGTLPFDSDAANTKITNSHFVNPSAHFMKLSQAGTELRMSNVIFTLDAGTLAAAMLVTIATTGIKGAIYMDHVHCNNGGTINAGFKITAPAPNPTRTSVPIQAFDVVWDNIAGPSWDIEYIDDVVIIGGWANSAVAGSHGGFRIKGGRGRVIGCMVNGSNCSVEFVGGNPYGWEFLGNHLNSGPIYRLTGPSSGDPTNLRLNDNLPPGLAIGNVTNEPARLRAAMQPLWTPPPLAGIPSIRESGVEPPAGYATLTGGTPNTVIIPHTGVLTNTRVRCDRERTNGPAGHIYSSVANNIVGTSFQVFSTDPGDLGSFYWRMHNAT